MDGCGPEFCNGHEVNIERRQEHEKREVIGSDVEALHNAGANRYCQPSIAVAFEILNVTNINNNSLHQDDPVKIRLALADTLPSSDWLLKNEMWPVSPN